MSTRLQPTISCVFFVVLATLSATAILAAGPGGHGGGHGGGGHTGGYSGGSSYGQPRVVQQRASRSRPTPSSASRPLSTPLSGSAILWLRLWLLQLLMAGRGGLHGDGTIVRSAATTGDPVSVSIGLVTAITTVYGPVALTSPSFRIMPTQITAPRIATPMQKSLPRLALLTETVHRRLMCRPAPHWRSRLMANSTSVSDALAESDSPVDRSVGNDPVGLETVDLGRSNESVLSTGRDNISTEELSQRHASGRACGGRRAEQSECPSVVDVGLVCLG